MSKVKSNKKRDQDEDYEDQYVKKPKPEERKRTLKEAYAAKQKSIS